MWQDIFEQFQFEATHCQRSYCANRIHLVSRVQQAIQDQAVSTDPLAFHARY